MNQRCGKNQKGFTIVELLIGMIIIAILIITAADTYTSLQSSAILARHKSIATEMATNKIEYLKSLPYDKLAVAGGAIQTTTPLPNTETTTINGYPYTIKLSINYIDDAFDGCANYTTQQLKEQLCRNYPSPSGAPAVDLNPADYKIANVKVYGRSNQKFAELDTQIAARVAETDSTTGALIAKVIDSSGNPISGATVTVVNNSVSPAINSVDSTDNNGNSVFYGLPPDTGNDYTITASKTGYSSVFTIKPTGSLTPNFLSQNIFQQLSSPVTLVINPMTNKSLLVETVDTNGNPISGVSVAIKGGYKKYLDAPAPATGNTEYYYDNSTTSSAQKTSGSDGILAIDDLVPGNYIFCGDNKQTGCTKNATNYTLATAIAYSGDHSFDPMSIPNYNSNLPTFPYGGNNYIQKIRLILTTDSSMPSVNSMTPSSTSVSSLGTFGFALDGKNLTCYTTGNGCPTQVNVSNGNQDFTATCTDDTGSVGTHMDCMVDLSSATASIYNLRVQNNGRTLNIPAGLGLLGGVHVTQ